MNFKNRFNQLRLCCCYEILMLEFKTFLFSVENHMTEVRHERGRKLWFDISEVSKESTLMMAELRIFQNPALGRWQDINKEFVITVYFVTDAET